LVVPEDATVSAVIVHFRGGQLLNRCIDSCLASGDVTEVLVVDNEGVAGRLRRELSHPEVRVVAMAGNAGYGRAANVGLRLSRGDAVLVMNQDVVLPPGTVAPLLEAGARAEAWLVGPRLFDAHGAEAPPKRGFPPPLRWMPAVEGDGRWMPRPWVPGAAMLFMPGHTTLRFDERLFMFGEDEELCWRVWSAGGRVVEARDTRVVHEGGTATGRRWGRLAITGRTVANRSRFVRWHRGWTGAARYLATAIMRGTATRLGGGDA
jgi:N-acetylglucosaminyl-diphospho-decaprenol L-rhamnosyltransferase